MRFRMRINRTDQDVWSLLRVLAGQLVRLFSVQSLSRWHLLLNTLSSLLNTLGMFLTLQHGSTVMPYFADVCFWHPLAEVNDEAVFF